MEENKNPSSHLKARWQNALNVQHKEIYICEAGNVWIYPTNYPIRNYQFDIVEKALYKNTLVTLPTGLGKTFIAAVVMYNFFRWYPQGKVIFMAPTKPLVAQQIEACYKIMGIPQSDTAEMTGEVWHFFFVLTSHLLVNLFVKVHYMNYELVYFS